MYRALDARLRLLKELRPPLSTQRKLLARRYRVGGRLTVRAGLAPARPAPVRRPVCLSQSRALCACALPPSKQDPDKAVPPARWSPRWIYQTVRGVAVHYWHGTKLLIADTRIASKLLLQLLRGRTLSRRENKLLVRVLADLLRVIPLAFFVIVPFMEFALPFAIRLFPNLLPSTFEEAHTREESRLRLLKVRVLYVYSCYSAVLLASPRLEPREPAAAGRCATDAGAASPLTTRAIGACGVPAGGPCVARPDVYYGASRALLA